MVKIKKEVKYKMEEKEICNSIKRWADNIEQIIYLADIKGKEYTKDYKLKDLQNISKLLRKCERCGKLFLPNTNYKKWQKYCDIVCRNQATQINKYQLKLDERQKPVDLLRKTIYERKYRARRDDKEIDLKGLDTILIKLKVLVKHRWSISEEDYNNKLADLQYEYETIVQKDRRK